MTRMTSPTVNGKFGNILLNSQPTTVVVVIAVFLVIVGSCSGSLITSQYSIVYMQESCRCTTSSLLRCEPFTLYPLESGASAGLIALATSPAFHREFYCSLTIHAPSSQQGVSIRLLSLHVPIPAGDLAVVGGAAEEGTPEGEGGGEGGGEDGVGEKVGGCQAGMLLIYDGPEVNNDKKLAGVCGIHLPEQTVYESTSSEITLSYFQRRKIIDEKKSFNLSFTYFTHRTNGCRKTEFKCVRSGHCIGPHLVCDGLDNCADGSDESTSFDVCGQLISDSDPLIGSSVLTCVLLSVVVLIIAIASYGARTTRWRQRIAGPPSSTLPVSSSEPQTNGGESARNGLYGACRAPTTLVDQDDVVRNDDEQDDGAIIERGMQRLWEERELSVVRGVADVIDDDDGLLINRHRRELDDNDVILGELETLNDASVTSSRLGGVPLTTTVVSSFGMVGEGSGGSGSGSGAVQNILLRTPTLNGRHQLLVLRVAPLTPPPAYDSIYPSASDRRQRTNLTFDESI